MKNYLKGSILSMLLVLGIAGPPTALSAELLWANVTIDRVLQNTRDVQARLTEEQSVFTNKLFNIKNDRQNAMLGVLLAAMALNKPVRIAFFDGSPAEIQLVGIINN